MILTREFSYLRALILKQDMKLPNVPWSLTCFLETKVPQIDWL